MSGWRKRTIMEMAREAGFEGCAELTWENVICTEELEAFAALVREDECEACAMTAENIETYEKVEKACFKFAAKQIRARGQA
jgi:hypothetical protein